MRGPGLALLAGLMSATGFAPWSLWPLTLLAFAVLLHLLARATTLRGALILGWSFGFGQFVLGLNWIATAFTYQAAMPAWLGWVAVVLLSVYLAVYPALAVGTAWRWHGGSPTRLTTLLAALWIVTEWLRATMFTGFAWNPVGVVWVGTPVVHAARYVGTYGLSALAVLAGGALSKPLHFRGGVGVGPLDERPARGKTPPPTPSLKGRGGLRHSPLPHTLILAALPLLAAVTGLSLSPTAPKSRHVRIVQPNIDQDTRNLPSYAYDGLLKLAALSQPPAAAAPPRLLLWPEAAVDWYLEEDAAARTAIAGLLRPGDILLTGGTALERNRDGKVIGARNSLFAMDARATLIGRYDKAHLVPYGEYLPARPILSAIGLSRLVPGDLDFWPGPGPRSYALPGFGTVGVQICYEIIFSGQVVDAAHRPDFLFNPSNDAWFGAWGPPQHLAQARLRAVEEGMPILRATPTGISAVIDPTGRLLRTLPPHTAGVIDIALPATLPPTPFARFGNLLSFMLAALLALAAIAVRRDAR